ncbi:uncharacterized protein PV09_01656 [Verruconis gallopava]|uniref:Uncharacterized protein n=1 Tax=Verruconis gallopava TaxID=253628 RepID=A0A0D1XY31_9PEZI|nr:uncharacterized protein PV09_01656 [Verruconis gallopava]KIW07726.1 hypothetical protein PV09_01656 [Verruconis gallopava]
MAATAPRVASVARQLTWRSIRIPRAIAQAPVRPAFFSHIHRRYASGTPHYDPAPPQIEYILYKQHAEPHTPEDWKEIGQSALQNCETQAERDAVQEYITNALKPSLTDEEVIAVASQVGTQITTPEELAAAHVVFKNMIKAATLAEAETLFKYYDQTGEFPAEIKAALSESLTKALASPTASNGAHGDHGHHDTHGHSSHHGGEHAKESFGIGWYLALGTIPFSWILMTLTRNKSDEENKPFLTRLIHKYDSWQDEWRRSNELHTKAVEQAGFDRLLFRHAATSDGRGTGKKEVRFEDAMNQGPQINVAPGSYINVDKVVEHYKKLNEETEERRLEIEKFYEARERRA